jgi:phospholipase/carboxylesterase
MTLERVDINETARDGAVIWLHGLGADGHDFEPIVPELGLPSGRIRFVFPHAPVRPVTINNGMEMRAWYDIDPRAPLAGSDDIRASADAVASIVAEMRSRGIPSRRIVLAGFSQGGVIALHLGLRHREPLGGIMALSTYVHDAEHLTDEISLENIDVPIFMAHGVLDPMIPITRAITSRETLRALNYDVEWHEYRMGHSVCPQEVADIARWMSARFPPTAG